MFQVTMKAVGKLWELFREWIFVENSIFNSLLAACLIKLFYIS